jgi:FMN phosphatase YigB (HAD superfamily)
VEHSKVLSVGDSLPYDVMPAVDLGMIGCLVVGLQSTAGDFTGLVRPRAHDILTELETTIKSNTNHNEA